MNNNKKYKKWSLGLVAPALVLAPIAVVASCSSSSEEKAVYSVSFKEANLSVKATTNIKPSNLSKEGFVQEIINNKANIFNIEDSSGQVTDDFLRTNLVVGDITPNDGEKTASAEVTLNNKNTDGGSENATITLTDLEELNLTTLKYKIDFVDKGTGTQEINLEGKTDISVETMNKEGLIQLVLEDTIKTQILSITGENADKITNDILKTQILNIEDSAINPDKANGKVTFTLKLLKPENGSGTTLEKTITFAGFKVETDSTPTEAYTIEFNDKGADSKYELTTVAQKTTEDYPDIQTIKPLLIEEKSVIFKATKGNLPSDDAWWESNLVISSPSADSAAGEITVTIQLNKSDSSSESTNIKEENVVLKGFKPVSSSPFLK